jgi:hypothetical protein
MAHYGGNRLMLFSAPLLYLLVATGGYGVFAWLWGRRQRWLALALTGLLLVALNPRAGIKENLSTTEEIHPGGFLEANLQPQDLIYVYYFKSRPSSTISGLPGSSILHEKGRHCGQTGLSRLAHCLPYPGPEISRQSANL